MSNGITHSNKDVLFKVLSRSYQNISLATYGLDIPRIKQMLPTDYPAVTATEIHADNAFLLEDGSLYLQEYESTVVPANFIKYTRYACAAMDMLRKDGIHVDNIIIGVIYTGDIMQAPAIHDLGALRIQVKQVFLSVFDTNSIYHDIKGKIENGSPLADEDLLRLIILPLTQPDKTQKQQIIENTIALAKQIENEHQQLFCIAGIITATNKFIDQSYKNNLMEWIKMTKVARWFEEEKIEAVSEARRKEQLTFAKAMLLGNEDYLKVMKYTGLTRDEVNQLQEALNVSA